MKALRFIPSIDPRVLFAAVFSLFFAVPICARAAENDSYIPEPVPMATDIEVTAYYYPGTEQMAEWEMVRTTRPEIKPLLSWYDEGNPEVVDWQIKWAVEHGISAFFVDWYWDRGHQRLNHWVDAFYKARFKSYLKWAVMWANHNEAGAHSEEDCVRVTQFWIDNYFNTPEYYRIDGRPVVQIWNVTGIDADLIAEAEKKGEKLTRGQGLKRALELMNKTAVQAGFDGIYFIEVHNSRFTYEELKEAGISETSMYNYNGAAVLHRTPEFEAKQYSAKKHPYDLIVRSIGDVWRDKERLSVLPFAPFIPTGWDDRPRSFQNSCVVYDRTPEKFRDTCRQAKAFCEEYGIRRVVLAPLNEWQEGSYIEPNEEYGFAMYDALRDVFCVKPETGWPPNLTPSEIGRGPYDYPAIKLLARTRWDFDRSTEGWYRMPYGAPELLERDGNLVLLRTNPNHVGMRTVFEPIDASVYRKMNVRMRLSSPSADGKERAKLYWSRTDAPIVNDKLEISEEPTAVCPVIADGEYHLYTLDLADSPAWKGQVNEFWFDPINRHHAHVEIDYIELVKE